LWVDISRLSLSQILEQVITPGRAFKNCFKGNVSKMLAKGQGYRGLTSWGKRGSDAELPNYLLAVV
jgi:hypothetical protein